MILTAEHDVLRDEGELYATRLLKAGVPVRHRRFAGQMHGFFTMVDLLPGAGEALELEMEVGSEVLGQPEQQKPPDGIGEPLADKKGPGLWINQKANPRDFLTDFGGIAANMG